MSALTTALLAELDEQALASLAERLRPYLDRPPTAELLSPAAAAAALGIHPKTLVRAAAVGRVPGAVRVGRAWRFQREGLALEPPAGILRPPISLSKRSARHDTAAAIAGNRKGDNPVVRGRS